MSPVTIMEPTIFIKPPFGEPAQTTEAVQSGGPAPAPERLGTLEKKNVTENTLKLFAGLGVVAVVALAAWAGVQTVSFLASGSLANVFSGASGLFKEEEITLEVDPSVVVTGDTVVLLWTHEGKDADGSYAFSYTCADDYYFTAPASLNEGGVVFCDTPFQFASEDNTLSITPISRASHTVTIPISIGFTPHGDERPSIVGNATISVAASVEDLEEIAGAGTTTPTTTTSSDGTPTPPTLTPGRPVTDAVIISGGGARASDPNGNIDLSISLIAVGELDDDDFTEKSPVDPDERVGIRFAVANAGTKESGTWEFEAKLPTEPSFTYNSPRQQSLFPGERIEFTLGFDRVEDDEESDTARIEIDPDGDLDDEVTRNNNTLTVTIRFDVNADDDDEEFEISHIDVEVNRDEITITWETDVRARSKVYWSTESDFDLDEAEGDKKDNDLVREHEIVIDADDLDEDTRYYFIVESEDDDGNVERSDEETFRTE